MNIYMLGNLSCNMAYWFEDQSLADRLMGKDTGRVVLPSVEECPILMRPDFGDASDQPTGLGDFHRFYGSCRIFSERAVECLSLTETGKLFPLKLEGRTENFFGIGALMS